MVNISVADLVFIQFIWVRKLFRNSNIYFLNVYKLTWSRITFCLFFFSKALVYLPTYKGCFKYPASPNFQDDMTIGKCIQQCDGFIYALLQVEHITVILFIIICYWALMQISTNIIFFKQYGNDERMAKLAFVMMLLILQTPS